MLRKNRLFTILVLVTLIFGACQPITRPPAATPQPPQGLRPDAPPYAVRGPYAVGTREFVLKMNDRSTPITVWYPALNPTGKPETITYNMDVGTAGTMVPWPVLGHAILNAPPAIDKAPYPLVIYSHGAYLYRQTAAYLTEHLASQGFIVVAGNHEDNWGTYPAPYVRSYVSRPADITAWIDFAEKLTAKGGELEGLIDTEHIGVAGHSFGGYAALAVGGAQLNPDWYLNIACAKVTTAADDPLNDCGWLPKKLTDVAAQAGLASVPKGLWPSWRDPRVDALMLLAPSSMFGPEGSAPVNVPTLMLTGSADPLQDAELNVYVTYQAVGSASKALGIFKDGGHTMFLNDCKSATGMAAVTSAWCSDVVWDTDRIMT